MMRRNRQIQLRIRLPEPDVAEDNDEEADLDEYWKRILSRMKTWM